MNKLFRSRIVLSLLLPFIFSVFGAGCDASQQSQVNARAQPQLQAIPLESPTQELTIQGQTAQIVEETPQVAIEESSSTVVVEAAATVQISPPVLSPPVQPPPSPAKEPVVVPAAPNGTYVNVDGNDVPRPYEAPSQPAGATAVCRDGTYSFSQNRRGTCSHHGGVAEWL